MNLERKAEWIAALRSGEYQQGRYFLQDAGCFCVWGVAAELAVKAGVLKHVEGCLNRSAVYYRSTANSQDWASVAPPDALTDWAGVEWSKAWDLIDINDSYERTFHGVADWIEVNL